MVAKKTKAKEVAKKATKVSLLDELLEATEEAPIGKDKKNGKNETAVAFARRIAQAVDGFEDPKFAELSKPAQDWFEEAGKAILEKDDSAIPLLTEADEAAEEDDAPPKKKAKKVEDDDAEDGDDDGDDAGDDEAGEDEGEDEGDEEEKPKAKTTKVKAKVKAKAEEDEDDEDEPPKKKKKVEEAPPKKAKKVAVEEEDEGDDDDEGKGGGGAFKRGGDRNKIERMACENPDIAMPALIRKVKKSGIDIKDSRIRNIYNQAQRYINYLREAGKLVDE